VRVFSYGGGVQSTAALVLAVEGRIDYPTFLFANVGDDSEHPATLAYVRDVAMPYAAQHGIELVELRYVRTDGEQRTLYQQVMRDDNRVDIPMFLDPIGAPAQRACTENWKIRVIDRELKRRGATPDSPGIVGMGISVDEYQRMHSDDPRYPYKKREYPLIDLRISRADCHQIIERAGLPVPPKSSCWFCPFHRMTDWRRLKSSEPALFARAVEVEQHVNAKRARMGKNPMWLSHALRPLDVAISGDQLELDLMCESGYCMT